MSAVIAPPALRQFIEDELVRAPMLVDQVIEGAVDHIRIGLPTMNPHERAMAGDLLQRSLANRQAIVDYYVASLREQTGGHEPARRAAPATLSLADSRFAALSLVDEDQVAIDVEISHTIEAIRSVADHELRELQTYVSALVGDMDVARDHNPFRPDVHARALWAAAQAVPLARGYQIVFMRHASMALAQVLRRAYAGAASRLESAGVVPATHRTVILPTGSRRQQRLGAEATFSPDLERLRESLPPGLAARSPLESLAGGAATESERQAVDLSGRLFDAIVADAALAADIRALLALLRAPALRLTLQEPKALDQTGHALWQFVDRVAFYGEILPTTGSPERERVLGHVQALVDQVAAEPQQTTALYQWALEHLHSFDRDRLAQRCAAVAAVIAQLQRLEDKLVASQATPSTMHGALDLAQLDTVPAELFDGDAETRRPAEADQQWLARLRPGDWVRMFMQGRWVHAQLLWPGERGELHLFGHGANDTTWAVRRNALLTLHAEQLLDRLEPRSLVRAAAKRVMRQTVR